jgi:hypothetical protein
VVGAADIACAFTALIAKLMHYQMDGASLKEITDRWFRSPEAFAWVTGKSSSSVWSVSPPIAAGSAGNTRSRDRALRCPVSNCDWRIAHALP